MYSLIGQMTIGQIEGHSLGFMWFSCTSRLALDHIMKKK
jgi:hypothetical protein